MRRSLRPTRLAAVVAAAGFVVALLPALGLPRSWPLVPVAWGALGLALGADALLLSRRAGHVTLTLVPPGVLYVGRRETLAAELTLARGHGPAAVEALADLSEELEPVPRSRGRLGPGPVTLRWELVPRRRGTARIERVWLQVSSPLGLWARVEIHPQHRELPVLPDLHLVRSTALRFFSDREFRAGLKIEQYSGDGTEFDSLKEFLSGDDRRAIDWKSSARHRKLVCRQYRAERNHQVVLALDTGHLMAETVDGLAKLDHAITAALLLAYVGLRSGDRVGLFTFGARLGPAVWPVGGVASMEALTQATASIAYSRDETNFTLGLTTLSGRLRRRSLVVLLTDFADTVTAELMLDNVDRIGRRHMVVFVSLRDPLLGRLAAGRPGHSEALHRVVVAADLLRDRKVVHRRLQRLGIHALDVEPARVGPELINQYLDIKRRELVA